MKEKTISNNLFIMAIEPSPPHQLLRLPRGSHLRRSNYNRRVRIFQLNNAPKHWDNLPFDNPTPCREKEAEEVMDKIKTLEGRIQFLERLTFVGFVLIIIMATKLGLSYLLKTP